MIAATAIISNIATTTIIVIIITTTIIIIAIAFIIILATLIKTEASNFKFNSNFNLDYLD